MASEETSSGAPGIQSRRIFDIDVITVATNRCLWHFQFIRGQGLIFCQGDQRKQLIVLLLDKHRVLLAEEPFRQAIGVAERHLLMRTQDGGDDIDTSHGLPVEATAVMIAAIADGA